MAIKLDIDDPFEPTSLAGNKKTGTKLDIDDPFDPVAEVTEPKLTDPPKEETSPLRRLPDPLVAAVKGSVGLVQSSLGIQDLMSFGLAGKTAELMGIRAKDAQKELDELLSPQQKEAFKNVEEAKGFFNTIGAAFANPSVISQTVIESLPSMIEGAGIGRGLMKFFPKLAPVIAGAIGEGTVTAGSMAEDIRADSESGFLTPAQVGLSTVAGGLTGLLGVLGGKLSKRLGFIDPETLLVGGINAASKDVRREAQKKIFRSVLESAISEGAFEELPQSAQEQMMQNLATGKPMTEGVAEAGVLGMLSGMVMGGGGGAGGHIMAGLEILKQDSKDTAKATEIQNFASSEDLIKLSSTDLLQTYNDGLKFQRGTPDDIDVTGALDVMKTELQKRGVWADDKLSVDIETKMAEFDEKMGGVLEEGTNVAQKAVAEKKTPSTIKQSLTVQKEQTLESEEGMANPPSTPEKTPSAQNTGSLVAKKGSEFGLKGLNKDRWTVDGNVMGNTPEEAVAEYDKQKQMAEDDAKQKETFDKVIPKLISGDYTEDDIKGITTFGKTTTTARQMDGILTSLGLTHKQAGQARKKAGDVDTTSKGAVLYDVGRTVETARAMGLLGKKKADVPKAQTVTEPLEKGLPVKEPKIKSSDMKTIKEVFGADNLEGIKTIYDDIVEMYPYASFHRHGNIVTKTIGASKEKDNFFYVLTPEGDIHLVNTYGGFPAKYKEVEAQWGKEEADKGPYEIEKKKADVPTKEEKPKVAKKPKPQKEVTLESYARKHKINFNIPGHTNKEAISDGLLSYTKNDAVGLDKAAEEMQGLGLLGATPDEYATAGDYLYAELQKIVYNRINKKTQSLTAEEDQAIKEMKEALKKDGYDESGIEREASESDRTGKKEAYSIKDSETDGEAQSLLEADEDFVKEEDETPTVDDYRSIAKKVDAFADGSYTPEDLKEIVDNQTKLDELDAQVPVGTTIRIKTGFGESILHKSSKKEGAYQISRFDTKGEAIGDSEYTNYEKAVKDLRHEQGSAVKAVDTLLPIIEKAKTQPETKAPSKELFDTSSMFTLSGNQPVESKTMKVPEKKGERLLDVKKQTTDELKDRLSGEKAKREFEEGKKKKASISFPHPYLEQVYNKLRKAEGGLTGLKRDDYGMELAGDNATLRSNILSAIVGKKVAKANSGINALMKAVREWIETNIPEAEVKGETERLVEPSKDDIERLSKPYFLYRAGKEKSSDQWEFGVRGIFFGGSKEVAGIYGDDIKTYRIDESLNPLIIAFSEDVKLTSNNVATSDLVNVTLPDGTILETQEVGEYAKSKGYDSIIMSDWDMVNRGRIYNANIFVLSKGLDKIDGLNSSLKVGTVPKGELLSDKESQALVTDILSILADGSSINFVGKIDPNRPDIQKALAEWKQDNPGASFTIEGMHKKIVVDGNKMASLIEIAMKGSSDIKLTAWHEAWHSIDELFLTANEQKILAEKLTPDIEKQANIFAKYAANQKHLLPNSAKPIFERIRTFFEKLGNYLKGRGFTSAEDVFDRALRGELKQRTARWTGEGDSALQISAKHGSPFVFDRFTTDRIGSGEGAQMFGWGLYFTDKEDVAKYYAEKLSDRKSGENYWMIGDRKITPNQPEARFDSILNQLANGVSKEDVIADLENRIQIWKNQASTINDPVRAAQVGLTTAIKWGQRAIEYAQSINEPVVSGQEATGKNLYNVTLHKGKDPSEYHYMDWEKPVGSKVGTVIRNGLPEDFIEDCEDRWNAPVEEWNGREAYDAIVRYAMEDALPGDTSMGGNPEKEASLFLLRNGIDGIKYPAGTLSGGKTDAFNYVVFDENAVTIEDRVSFKMANGKFNAAFRKWFGNSKVVDENGKPLVVYHGTWSDFSTFKKGELGFHFGSAEQANDRASIINSTNETRKWIDRGMEVLGGKSPNVMPVYLSIQNPYDIVSDLGDWNDMDMLREYLTEGNEGPFTDAEFDKFSTPDDVRNGLIAKGYDGIKYQNSAEGNTVTGMGGEEQDAYIAFSPTQIKSIYNQGTWDENDPRISFKITPFIKNLISSNSKKAVNPETSFKDGKDDFKRQFKEVLGKDYSNWKAHFYLPFFKGHGPNAEPLWKRAFDNTEAGREKRSELNSHYTRKMHDFLDMPKEKTRNIEKVLSEGDAVLAQQIRDLIAESVTAKNGGNLELAKELREKAQAIKDLNRYSDEELAEGITLRTGEVVRLTPQEAKVYTDVRTAFDEMHRDQFKHQIEMVFGKHRDKAWYSSMIDLFEDRPDSPEFGSDKRNTLKALNKLALGKIRGKKAETIQKNRDALMEVLKSHISTVSGITDQTELNGLAGDMLKAYKTEKVLMNAIKKARNRIGQQVAYFPRVRERGNVYANIFKTETKTDKNGEEKVFKTMIHSQVVKNAEEARQLWEQYKSDPSRKNDDLSYELGAVNKESDSTYVGVNDMNLQRVIDNAIERIRNTRNLDSGPLLDSLKTSMVQAVANEMKSRGFGKSSITRRLNLIEGYKKTDLQKVALDYITGMTGMMTKQETAMNFHDILKDIPRDKPKLYNDIGKYAQDMLRNQNGLDRASGKARGITFIYYLGGNLKSALVQLTQNHVTAIPKLAEKMREWGVKGIAEAKYHKAMADAARIKVNEKTGEVKGKSINQWESRLLTDFLHRGNTADQYMQYITGRMQNELGQKFGAVMNVLSKPFGKMETFNRESASLAMFRMAWNYYTETIPDLEERYAKAYEEAKEYVNFTHFAYGKENLPRIATGGDLASVSARTLLTFRSFNHNYIQSIFGSKDWKTMAHSLAYVALFGGMMGLPFIKDLSDLLEKLTGKSYTKSAREVMRKFGGKTLETFGVQGLPALAGANISGSMAIGIPLVGETATDTVTGVMGGMFDKAKKGVRFAAKGQAYKAAESLLPEMVANPMKALRMSDVGKEYLGTPGYATTSSGKPVFDENGKPLKMSMTDMALKTIGINPAEYSMRTEAQRSASNIEEYFSDWKTNIYEEYRAGASTHDAKAISKALRQIREYNQAIIDKEASGLVQRIKMSNVVKAAKMSMTKKQKREAQYKKNYLDT